MTVAERDRLKQYEPFFGEWYIRDKVAQGIYGYIYEIVKQDSDGSTVKSALKFMHVPSENGLNFTKSHIPDMKDRKEYFSRVVHESKNQIRLQQMCRMCPNIVTLEDY